MDARWKLDQTKHYRAGVAGIWVLQRSPATDNRLSSSNRFRPSSSNRFRGLPQEELSVLSSSVSSDFDWLQADDQVVTQNKQDEASVSSHVIGRRPRKCTYIMIEMDIFETDELEIPPRSPSSALLNYEGCVFQPVFSLFFRGAQFSLLAVAKMV